jgi:hypothetical protein
VENITFERKGGMGYMGGPDGNVDITDEPCPEFIFGGKFFVP